MYHRRHAAQMIRPVSCITGSIIVKESWIACLHGGRTSPKRVSRSYLRFGFTRRGQLASLSGVQRLYSMFPLGAPGVGLVLLRLAMVVALFVERQAVMDVLPGQVAIPCLLLIAIALVTGVLTSVFTSLGVVLSGVAMLHGSTRASWIGALILLIGGALLLLGPGAYSLDARIYGRRIVTLRRRK